MPFIEFENLFPENQKPSESSEQQANQGQMPFGMQDLFINGPFEVIDLSRIKQNNITVNALYNLLLQKGIITAKEYQDMKHKVHRQLYPEDFGL